MKVLILSTWFPYPLSQGSKIRAYHLIKAVAKQHDVGLISFADVPVHLEWIDHLKQFCEIIEVIDHDPFTRSRFDTWRGWFSLQPSSVRSGYSKQMARKVHEVAQSWIPDLILALTFVTAPYALEVQGAIRVIDIDNLLTSYLHEDYLLATNIVQRLQRWLAWRKFRRYESQLFQRFDLCLVVSSRDAKLIQSSCKLQPERVAIIPNGANVETGRPNAIPVEENTLIFNGSLRYAPNFDAMHYFLQEIFPLIKTREPNAKLTITGKTEGVLLERLPQCDEHVRFTGYLDDISPVVAGSCVCVVPLRIGAGSRLKILEAMALGTPVVSTSKGVEGLDVEKGKHLLIGDSPSDFANQTLLLLHNPGLCDELTTNALHLILEKYSWINIGRELNHALDNIKQR